MCVGIDAEHASEINGLLVPPPIQIQPPGIGINLYCYAVLCAGGENTLNVDIIPGPSQKLTSRHMAKNGRIWICHRPQNTFCLRLRSLRN